MRIGTKSRAAVAFFLLAPLSVAVQDPPRDPLGETDREILQANVEFLASGSEDVRRAAEEAICRYGVRAVPFLEAKLREKKCLIYCDLIRKLERRVAPELLPQQPPDDPELLPAARAAATARAIDRETADQFLLLRFRDAYHLVLKKDYDTADAVLRAIRVLDNGWKFANETADLHAYVQRQMVESKYVRARAVPEKTVIGIGESVDVKIRLRNIHPGRLVVARGNFPAPVLRANMVGRAFDFMIDAQQAMEDTVTAPWPESIDLDKEGTWETTLRLETRNFLPDSEAVREYTVRFQTTSVMIETGEERTAAKIQCPPLVIKAIPPRYLPYAVDPLNSFRSVLDGAGEEGGTVQEVMVCAFLLRDREAEMRQAAGMLIDRLEQATNPAGIRVTCRVLEFLTGQRLGPSKEAWVKWHKGK